MRFQPGMVLCLLAGCAVHPTASAPSTGSAASPAATAPPPIAPPGTVLRIGVEFLPPDATFAAPAAIASPRVEFLPSRSTGPRREPAPGPWRRPDHPARHTWAMSESDLANIDDPIERETRHFVDDLVAEDARRVRREVRLPFLDWQPGDLELGPRLWSEEATATAQAEWVNTHGPSLLQRPMRRLLRRLPIARDVEIEIDDFRSENVPLSEPYREMHRAERKLGRLSLRVHIDDATDPLEIAYMRSGVRVGTSQEIGKLSVDWRLSDRVVLELRGRTAYDTQAHGWRADLSFWPSPTTSLHLSAGDDMDFLATSSIYSLFESPIDGSPGLLIHAVHIF